MLVQSLFFAHDEMGFDTTLCHGLFGPSPMAFDHATLEAKLRRQISKKAT